MSTIDKNATEPLERIGAGHCGSVWGVVNSAELRPIAVKREDGGKGRSITKEFNVQSQVCTIAMSQILVPRVLQFLEPADQQWDWILPRLPRGLKRCNAMISEKIKPVSLASRKLLVDKYCPAELRQEILESRENQHCLARIYLGRRRLMHKTQRRHGFFSLRNIPLHADQIEELGLPSDVYARAMAEALATLHWRMRTDGADVEFVLGAPRDTIDDDSGFDKPLSEHSLWMLDYDCSGPITADKDGTGPWNIARAFWRNDPYYPRPSTSEEDQRGDTRLWAIFSAEYRRVGREIVTAYPREGENVEALHAMVDSAISTIEATAGQF
jgi:hypothetical protein